MRTAIVTGAIAAVVAVILLLGAGDQTGPNAFVVIGVTNGAVYGLVALGLVLVYKGSRVFNFAQGEFGTMAAFIVYVLIEQVQSVSIPYPVAALIAIVAVVLIGLFMERTIVRPLMNRPRITLLVATIAFALALIGLQILLFLPEGKILPPILPTFGADNVPQGIQLFNFIMEPQRILTMGVLAGFAVILGYFFSRTDLGLAVLATSQDAYATRVVGIGVERMSRFIWGSAAFLGAVAGILYVPLTGTLAPGSMTAGTGGVLILAFTAAVVGGMTSLPGAFLGGVVIGLIKSLADWSATAVSFGGDPLQNIVPGFSNVAVFAALLIVLLIRPQGLLGSEA